MPEYKDTVRNFRDIVSTPETAIAKHVEQVSVNDAKHILLGLNNGTIQGISPGKGGRVWLEGEFELCYLEAIAVLTRHVAGDGADGAIEHLTQF